MKKTRYTDEQIAFAMKEEDWDKTLNVDLKSVFNCTQAVLGHMMAQKYGQGYRLPPLTPPRAGCALPLCTSACGG